MNLRALVQVPLLALLAASLTFVAIEIAPGDPVDARLGESAAPADRAAVARSLGLDRSAGARWWSATCALARGDLGVSWANGRPNRDLILERLPATLDLAGRSLALAALLAVLAAVVASRYAGGRIDAALGAMSMVAAATPTFVSGPILIWLLAIGMGILPVAGRRDPGAWVMPSIALAIPLAAGVYRVLRAGMESRGGAPFVRAVRARGVGPWRLAAVHLLPNAAGPALAVFGVAAGELLTGAVVAESLFAWPGLGRLAVDAIRRQDHPLIAATAVAFAVLYALATTALDGLARWVDPRLEAGQ